MNDRIEQEVWTEDEVLAKANQLKAEKEKLEAENRELRAYNNLLRTHEESLKENARIQYAQGLIDALVFAVRCNGVSGSDVDFKGAYGRCGDD